MLSFPGCNIMYSPVSDSGKDEKKKKRNQQNKKKIEIKKQN